MDARREARPHGGLRRESEGLGLREDARRSWRCQPDGVHGGQINALAVSPDGKRAVTGSSEGSLALWDIAASGELTLSKKIRSHAAACVAFLPDGSHVISGGPDEKLVVTDLATGEHSRAIEPHRSWIVSLALSRDARTVVSAGWYPGTADVWSLEDGKHRTALEKHSRSIRSLALSPDGTLLATGSIDKTLVIWRTDEWTPVATIDAEGSVGTVAFSPDGRSVAAGQEEADPSLVTLWDLAGD
ncbi:hypothetical protein HY251_05080 [bacterium]|nr:hypothetical protein [bacterium]